MLGQTNSNTISQESGALTVSYSEEFQTVDLILDSTAETRGVDAFALSLIKAERQIRRVVTHLIFQFPCFGYRDIKDMRETLADNQGVYFEGLERGIDALYPRTVKELIGEDYDRLRDHMKNANGFRNKIFHGQLPSKYLSRGELLSCVNDIRAWSQALAKSTLAEFGYDGFRDSFRKSEVPALSERFKVKLSDIAGYSRFIQQNMQRPKGAKHAS